jgi:hemin uptake protein HemP
LLGWFAIVGELYAGGRMNENSSGAPLPQPVQPDQQGDFVFTHSHRNAGQPVRRITSAQLFGTNQEIEIEHGGSCYRLRQTALGKLIMTK